MRLMLLLATFAAFAGCAKSSGPQFEDALAGGPDDPEAVGPGPSFHRLTYEATLPWYDTSDELDTAVRVAYMAYVAAGAFCFASVSDEYVFNHNKQLPMVGWTAPNGTNQLSVFLDWEDTDYIHDHLHLAFHVPEIGWQLSPRMHRGETTEFSVERVARDTNGTIVIDEAWMCLADESHDFVVDRVDQGETPPWFIGSFDIKVWFDAV